MSLTASDFSEIRKIIGEVVEEKLESKLAPIQADIGKLQEDSAMVIEQVGKNAKGIKELKLILDEERKESLRKYVRLEIDVTKNTKTLQEFRIAQLENTQKFMGRQASQGV